MTDELMTYVPRGSISAAQYEVLMRPLKPERVAERTQGGKKLHYLKAWDVRAHLIRLFGFGNFDIELLDYRHVTDRAYQSENGKDMVESIYSARVLLALRDSEGMEIARYCEGAVGSASGPATMLGEHHDNGLKQAVSDATKRCAINLGSQFGLSLYDDGGSREVVRSTVVTPSGYTPPEPTPQQVENLQQTLGAQKVEESGAASE